MWRHCFRFQRCAHHSLEISLSHKYRSSTIPAACCITAYLHRRLQSVQHRWRIARCLYLHLYELYIYRYNVYIECDTKSIPHMDEADFSDWPFYMSYMGPIIMYFEIRIRRIYHRDYFITSCTTIIDLTLSNRMLQARNYR